MLYHIAILQNLASTVCDPESIRVTNFTISVYGSSCNAFFFTISLYGSSCNAIFLQFLCTAVHAMLSFYNFFVRQFMQCFFTISVYGSSCNAFFFGLLLSSFLSPFFLNILACVGMPKNRKREQRSKNEAENR